MKYQYRVENFVLFDCVGLERRLSQMAEKGLQLESIGRLFWKYRVTEPKKLTYSITYAPTASLFDPQPTEEQQLLTDYCSAAGWQKVCDLAQLQIFATEKPNPTPIETDESIRLNIIKQSMKKNIMFGPGLLSFVFLLNVLIRLSSFVKYPLTYLPDEGFFNSLIMMTFGILCLMIDLFYYLLWKSKAEKAVVHGGSLPEAKHYRSIATIVWGILILLFLKMLFGDTRLTTFMSVYLIGMAAVSLMVYGTQQCMRKKGVSKVKNIVITLVVDCVLCIALFSGLIYFGVGNYLSQDETTTYYNVHGFQYPLYQDELPLYVSDLIDEAKDYPYYSYKKDTDESLFLKAERCSQDAPPDGEDHPEMRYEIYTVKMDFLYDDVLNALIEDEFRYYTEEGRAMSAFIPQNTSEWNVDAVYQLSIGDSEGSIMENKWILCKDHVIVYFRPFFDLTDEMKLTISEKLLG